MLVSVPIYEVFFCGFSWGVKKRVSIVEMNPIMYVMIPVFPHGFWGREME